MTRVEPRYRREPAASPRRHFLDDDVGEGEGVVERASAQEQHHRAHHRVTGHELRDLVPRRRLRPSGVRLLVHAVGDAGGAQGRPAQAFPKHGLVEPQGGTEGVQRRGREVDDVASERGGRQMIRRRGGGGSGCRIGVGQGCESQHERRAAEGEAVGGVAKGPAGAGSDGATPPRRGRGYREHRERAAVLGRGREASGSARENGKNF